MQKPEINFETFTPAEAEVLTGVRLSQQRDWRRHGFIPKVKGHARFDLYDISLLTALKILASRLGPKDAVEVSELLAIGIFYQSLQRLEVYQGIEDIDWSASESYANGFAVQGETDRKVLAGYAVEAMLQFVSGLTFRKRLQQHYSKGRVIPSGQFVLWADNSEEWVPSIDAAIKEAGPRSPKVAGPVIIVDQAAAAQKLIAAAPRKFVNLEKSAS